MSRKQKVLSICWKLGLFQLTRKFYRKKLQILCYHGYALEDEADFRPKLFIRPEVFHKRMALLKQNGFNVVTLNSALKDMSEDRLADNTVTITIDDGFYNVLALADPIFREFNFPYTIYLTTYYAKKETPIYRLAMQYMFWKSQIYNADFSSFEFLSDELRGSVSAGTPQAEKVCWEFINYGETLLTEPKRCELSQRIGKILGIDYQHIVDAKLMALLTLEDCKVMFSDKVDFQLHTHHHNLPDDADAIKREIEDNRQLIRGIHDNPITHFCYPSGLWSESQWQPLRDANVVSATTCLPGLNDKNSPMFGLHRFLDGENISEIEYLAEICGFSEFLRSLRIAVNRFWFS